ncbi:MAG: DUF3108 domain-containing protein [Clostridia bacterium]
MLRSSLLLISAAFAGAAAAAPPRQVELDWDLSKDGSTIAVIEQKLAHGAGRYEISETWEGRGFFRLLGGAKRLSRGEVSPGGLRPLEYTDERSNRDPERASFDWKAKTVTYQYKGAPATIPLPAHATDDLAALFGFAFGAPIGKQVLMDVVNGRGVSDRVFTNEGPEKVATPAGTFDAVKLVRRKDNGDRAEIWLAADRGYLPVRVLVVDRKGTRLDQVLTRLTAAPH